MANLGDYFNAKQITFDRPTVDPFLRVGHKILESDGPNLFFDGKLLASTSNVVTDFSVLRNLYIGGDLTHVTNIYADRISSIDFGASNVTVRSNVELADYAGALVSGQGGIQSKDGELYYNGIYIGGSGSNVFQVMSADLITPFTNAMATVTMSSNVLFQQNILASSIVSSAISLRTPNVYVVSSGARSSTNFVLTDTATGNTHAAARIVCEPTSATRRGGTVNFKARDASILAGVDDGDDAQSNIAGYRTSETTGKVFVIEPDVKFSVGTGWTPPYKFTVGTAAGPSFSVDTDTNKTILKTDMKLEYDSNININMVNGNRIGIGKNCTPGNQSVAIGNAAAGIANGGQSVSIGLLAGFSAQGDFCTAIGAGAGSFSQSFASVAIGQAAGGTSQGESSVAVGQQAGANIQGNGAVAIGVLAGTQSQGIACVAIGKQAAETKQGIFSTAIGYASATGSQGIFSTAIGAVAGWSLQGDYCVAIGYNAARSNQGESSVAIGYNAALNFQQPSAVAIGYQAGLVNQQTQAMSIGYQAGMNSQQGQSISIGYQAGMNSQQTDAVAIGYQAGMNNQKTGAMAIGYLAGNLNQAAGATAIGTSSGESNQGSAATAIGQLAGNTSQGAGATAIGFNAGQSYQRTGALAIGYDCARTSQGVNALALGTNAGDYIQGASSISIGVSAGSENQLSNAIAIGYETGLTDQKTGAVAVGTLAGRTTQGENSIAIGYAAGQSNQADNTIVINASGIELDGTGGANRCYIKPVGGRSVPTSTGTLQSLFYDTDTSEVFSSTTSGKTFVIDHPDDPANRYLVHTCLEGPEVGVYYRGRDRIPPMATFKYVKLPDYVRKLIVEDSETINVTPIFNGKKVCALNVGEYDTANNSFTVHGDHPCEFNWVFYAKRSEMRAQAVEPLKKSVTVKGDGPYKYILP